MSNISRIKYSLSKGHVFRVKRSKKPKLKKPKKERKRKCDCCRRRVWPELLVVHHKGQSEGQKIVQPKNYNTEGICVVDFDKLYSDKRKRPLQDRRRNILILCKECYERFTSKE